MNGYNMDEDWMLGYDIRGQRFEEFVAFLFDQPCNPEDPWYWHAEVAYDPREVARHYMDLFQNPRPLVDRYTRDELEQGFWAAQSCNLDCAVSKLVFDKALSLEARAACIRAMYELYEKLFAHVSLDTAPHMWWDSLASGWSCGYRDRSRGGDDEKIQDVMFETLSRILSLSDPGCQYDALHGLGHLHHPGTAALIADYLQRNDVTDGELREYAEGAARFEVM
jgi:hypothetical protein